jgi:nucleoside-diphosphate-sugar epimerase
MRSHTGVLITGATGLIGGELLRQFILNTNLALYCLVRAKTREHAQARLLGQLTSHGLPISYSSRFTAFAGDITQTDLGLDREALKELKHNVSLVFHCAASTYFIKTKDCDATNVESLGNVLVFIRRLMKKPTLFYFGTAACSGHRPNATLTEDQYPDLTSRHFVAYTQSKARAEMILERQAQDLEVVTIRPSMVFPDKGNDVRLAREAVWALHIISRQPLLPLDWDARVDVVPLSIVGLYTLRLAAGPRKHKRYHITAGPCHSPRWRQFVSVLLEYSKLGSAMNHIAVEEWPRYLRQLPRGQSAVLKSVSLYFPFINQNITYDCSRLTGEFGAYESSAVDIANYLPRIMNLVSYGDAVKYTEFN